ncbi:unnamed protein product, partial [Pylaiella littoralis]
MLAAGGRVVRVDHDSSVDNRLMVPTERELKTILYNQVTTRVHHHRDCIDYVSLNAKRKPWQKGDKNWVYNKFNRARISGDGHITTGRRTCAPGRSHVRQQKTDDTCRQGPSHSKTASPGDDESGEDEDVSLFMESFSASGMVANKFPASASEPDNTTRSLPGSRPCRDTLDGQARDAEAVVVDNTQATLAMSKPLAQIDLYSILARAPPAERGSAEHESGESDEDGGPTVSKKIKARHRRKRGSSKRLGSISKKGKQRAFNKGVRPTARRQEVDGYIARDPLGDEVAALNTKVQESLRRIKEVAGREKSAPNVGLVRHYAALLAKESKPPKVTKRMVDENGKYNKDGTNKPNAPASPTAGVAVEAIVDGGGDHGAACIVQGLGRRHRRDGAVRCRRSKSNRRTGKGNNSKEQGFDADLKGGTGACSTAAGTQVGWNGEGGCSRDARMEKISPAAGGYPHAGCNESTGEKGGLKHQQRSRDNRVENDHRYYCHRDNQNIHGGDYGKKSLESTNRTGESDGGTRARDVSSAAANRLVKNAGTRARKHGLISRDGTDDGVGNGQRRQEESDISDCGAALVGGRISEDGVAAAALQIEACWRGFLGRCAAKCALRSALLNALRIIGGGKLSKVVSLADVEQEDRRGLNRALRVATQSRRQLPPQAHIVECVRFVKLLQIRRTRVVEARKRRWV